MSSAIHTFVLISHIVFVVAAVGVVSVTDYLHLVGLRNKVREKRLLFVYPLLGRAIILFILSLIITGTLLTFNEPGLLLSSLFQLKLFLFGVILINGWVLHKYVSPNLTKCVLEGGTLNCRREVLLVSAFTGSISLASWYGVLILSITKSLGYSVPVFLVFYIISILGLFSIALYAELRARKWEELF